MELKEGFLQRKRKATRFFILAGVVSVVALCTYLVWSGNTQSADNMRRALAEARVLSAEIGAAWDYVDSIQPRTAGATDGKGLGGIYCAVAAKDIAERFSEESEYSIRYVRESPRNTDDAPDSFEAAALSTFVEEDGEEVYGMVYDDDRAVFRYVALLSAEEGCLTCHGDPAGEKDVVGYFKEGMHLGDVAGAISIIMPMDAIVEDARSDLVSTAVFFCVLMAVVTIILAMGLRAWVTAPIMTENEKLRRESEDQSNFLTIMTHELKTPLSSMLAFTELWKERVPDDSSESRELVDEVQTNGRVLLNMVNNVLDAAKLDAGALRLAEDEVDIFDLVAQVKATMGPLAKRKSVSFAVEIDRCMPLFVGDEEMLRRVVVNLVNNALRFTDSGGAVRLSFTYDAPMLVIRVFDTGCGIAPELIDTVFDRFVSTPNSESSGEGGTGLGLSIVRNFAELMGGTAKAESQVGVGSVLTVLLPLPVIPDVQEEEEQR